MGINVSRIYEEDNLIIYTMLNKEFLYNVK